MESLCSIGEMARLLGVAVSTLRRWHANGVLIPSYRTPGGHRRYAEAQRKDIQGEHLEQEERMTIAYARVLSHDQKEQLVMQETRLTSSLSSITMPSEMTTRLQSLDIKE